MNVDRCPGWMVTNGLPIGGGGIPGVFHLHVTPKWFKRYREVAEVRDDEHKEHKELEVVPVHGYRGSLGWW